MHPVLLTLPGGHPVYSYGALLSLSIALGWFISSYFAERRDGFPPTKTGWLYAVTIGSAVLGSRVLYVVTNLDRFSSLAATMRFTDGGLVAYGGFLGGFAGAWAFCRVNELSILAWADAATPSMAFGLFLTRLGCLLYGCDYGRPWSGPWALRFPAGSPAWLHQRQLRLITDRATTSLPVHPTQLYESAVGLALFGFLVWVWSRRKRRGEVLVAFTLGYGALRFVLELVRGDDQRGEALGLSTSQWIGMVTCAAAALLWRRLRR